MSQSRPSAPVPLESTRLTLRMGPLLGCINRENDTAKAQQEDQVNKMVVDLGFSSSLCHS